MNDERGNEARNIAIEVAREFDSVFNYSKASINPNGELILRLTNTIVKAMDAHTPAVGDAAQQARELADRIVSFMFDDYPDNDMNRGQAIEYIAETITTALQAAAASAREDIVDSIRASAEKYGEAGNKEAQTTLLLEAAAIADPQSTEVQENNDDAN